jgi:hypothetical protein
MTPGNFREPIAVAVVADRGVGLLLVVRRTGGVAGADDGIGAAIRVFDHQAPISKRGGPPSPTRRLFNFFEAGKS